MLCVYCPPVGSIAFRRHLAGLRRIGSGQHVPLVVHVSLTDRCPCSCRRCSNFPGGQADPSLSAVVDLLAQLRQAGTATVAFTGGEPLLREDLPEIVAACGPEMCSVLFTTGYDLTEERARDLRAAGLTAAFVSLDHDDAAEHDRIRGRKGAFEAALHGIRTFGRHGMYTAVQAVVSHELLDDAPMARFLRFCQGLGVHEIMLLEPVPVGGRTDTCAALRNEDRLRLISIHRRAARDHTLPKVNAMSFLEGPELFGCQAGFSFMYVGTSGEILPCDLVPLSAGNVYQTDLRIILDRLSACFDRPSCSCLAHEVAELAGRPLAGPVEWDQTQDIMARRRIGEFPRLMRLIGH
jgi:MoaA/NifB/PqqE/SkfB family radical SAM enzyme